MLMFSQLINHKLSLFYETDRLSNIFAEVLSRMVSGNSRNLLISSKLPQVSVLTLRSYCQFSGFGGLEVACWPLVPKFVGSNPAEVFGFFRAKKILSTLSFGREVKPSVPCRRFTTCKRSLNVTWKSDTFRQNSSAISRPSSSSFHY